MTKERQRPGGDGTAPPSREGFRLPTFSMGRPRPSINIDKSLRLATNMEDEEKEQRRDG